LRGEGCDYRVIEKGMNVVEEDGATGSVGVSAGGMGMGLAINL